MKIAKATKFALLGAVHLFRSVSRQVRAATIANCFTHA